MALRAAKSFVPSPRTVALCVFLIVTASGLPSCAVTDFVSAYFNTYYNAQRVFSEAEGEVMAQLDARPGGRNFLLTFTIPTATKTKLASVIEKCSKLLQYHPDSKLIDDALLMIGKSYYYEDENQQAVRKFNEIIGGYPDGSCATEARLLLAYAEYRMNARDEARKTADTVLVIGKKNDQPEMISRASLVLGQMAQEDKDYANATEYFKQAAQFGATAEQRSSAWLMSAEMYRRMQKYPEAEDAYRLAAKASNNYAGEYRGRMGEFRMREKQGKMDEALAGYRLLRSDAKNKEFFGEIELEIANTYRDKGDLPGAVVHYTLVDTAYPRSEVSAKSYFALGDLYEHTLYLYDSALVIYAKGRNEFPMAEVSLLCARRADYLTKYFQYIRDIAKFDSIRTFLLTPPESLKVEGSGQKGVDSVRLAGAKGTDSLRLAGTKSADSLRLAARSHPVISLDSANTKLETTENELAGLFYATVGLPDSAEYWYRHILTDYMHGRFAPRALYTLAQIYLGRDSVAFKPAADSLYRQIIEKFPRSDFAPEARRLLGLPPVQFAADEADVAYDNAVVLLTHGDSTAAAEAFKGLARKYPASPLASRALYAAGWIYENHAIRRDSAFEANRRRVIALYRDSTAAGMRVNSAAGKRDSTLAVRHDTAFAAKRDSMIAGRRDSTIAGRRDSTIAGRRDSTLAVGRDTAFAAKRDSTIAGRRDSAFAGRRDSTLAVRRDSAFAAKRDSAFAARRDSALASVRDTTVSSFRDSAIASYSKLLALYPGSLYASRVGPKMAEVTQRMKLSAPPDTSAAHRALPGATPGGPLDPEILRKRGEPFRPRTGGVPPDTAAVKKTPDKLEPALR